MAKLSRGRQPPTDDGSGGWHFPQSGIVLRASTEELLIKLIFEFRQRNNIAIGDIEHEIDQYYCTRWPTACHPEPGPGRNAAPAAHREPMVNRIARWASIVFRAMPRGGYSLATAPEAQARGQSCLGCPKNVSWRVGCAGCHNSTLKLVTELKRARKTTIDGNLLACEVGGWSNAASVWLPAECSAITDEQRAQMPARCWRKAIP